MKVFVVTNDTEERTRIIRRLGFDMPRTMDYRIIRPETLNSIIARWDNNEPVVLILVLSKDKQDSLKHLSMRIRHLTHVNDKAYVLVLNTYEVKFPEWANGFVTCSSFSQLRVRLREIARIEEQKAKRRKYKLITTSLFVLCALEGVLLAIYSFMVRDTVTEELYGSIMISAALIVLAAWMLTYYTRYQRISERREARMYSDRIQRAISIDMGVNPDGAGNCSSSQKVGVMERMTINLEDIKEYYVWSQKQAKYSFWGAIVLCFIGIMLLVVAILLPTLFGQGITPAIISAIGGAVTELLAGTVLFVYKSSLSQLNHYHCALHEDERFLSSVSLVDKLSTVDEQDAILEKIIDAELLLNFTEHQSNSKDNQKRR